MFPTAPTGLSCNTMAYFSLEFEDRVQATDEISRSLVSFADVLVLTTTVPQAGEYELSVSYRWKTDGSSVELLTKVLVNGVEDTHFTNEHEKPVSNFRVSFNRQIVSLNAGVNTIKLQFASGADTKTVFMNHRRITVEKYG